MWEASCNTVENKWCSKPNVHDISIENVFIDLFILVFLLRAYEAMSVEQKLWLLELQSSFRFLKNRQLYKMVQGGSSASVWLFRRATCFSLSLSLFFVPFFHPPSPLGWMVFFTPVASFQTDDRHRKKQSKLPVMYSGEMKKSSWSFLEEKHFWHFRSPHNCWC